MATKKTAVKKVEAKKIEGIRHYGESKASKAHAFVRQAANLKKDQLELQKELAKKFKVHANTARNWARDFQSKPIAATA